MVEGFDHGAAIGQLAQAIKAHGIQALEDVAVLAVLWSAAMLFDEPLYLLETGDDPLLARRPARLLLRLGLDAKLGEKRVILVGKALSHVPPPPSCVEGTPRPRPCAFPKRRPR